MPDPALLHALQTRFPPEQPAYVEERVWQSVAGAQAERIGRRAADSFEKMADEWVAHVEAMRLEAEGLTFETDDPAGDLQVIAEIIADFEAMADLRAIRSSKTIRQMEKRARAAFKVDPSVGAARREFARRMAAIEQRLIDALLEHALLLRAVRAQMDPASRGGPVFDNPDDLAKHLAGLGAA